MNSSTIQSTAARAGIGGELHRLIADLYPICRSITGEGLRETLRAVGKLVPLTIREVPTGTQVFDWTVPKEWNIRDAYVMNSRGERVIDFQASKLHVVNYSVPVHRKMRLAELKTHLFSLPDRPDWIPYRTSYYEESWGFCVSQRQLELMSDDEYEVVIDSTLQPGHLSYGECYLPGDLPDEIIVSTHCCHPSMCNDNLSGIAVAAFLAKHLSLRSRRYSYRFLFIPGTIGAITWLALNEEKISRIRHGLVLTGLGDSGKLHYKRGRRGDAEIDRAAMHVLQHSSYEHQLLDFSPYGYDERQFCSPGINLPVGRLSRSPHGTFPEYHTSADNLGFVHPEKLEQSFDACLQILSLLDRNGTFLNLNPKCEPQLGRRGLYGMVGGSSDAGVRELAMLWVLNLSDGNHSLLDITERSNLAFDSIYTAAEALLQKGLLRECLEFSPSEPAESLRKDKIMNAIYIDTANSDEQRRDLLYAGQLVVHSPTASSLALVEFARQMLTEAFDGADPETAQFHLPVERYAAILAELKPKFIHHPKSKECLQGILRETGCDLSKTYFDVPRMRTSTSDQYLTTGIAYAFHPHRDTWYSAPMCQINWWMPIYPIVSENAMAFHPRYWNQPVRNGSATYNYDEWNRTSRQNAAQFLKEDTRKQPRPEEPMELDPQVRVIAPPGGLLLFSGAQMHSSVPNTSGRTRLSIDFRTVHVDDVVSRRGAPNVDSECTGTCMHDYLRGTDFTHVPEELYALYQTQPPLVRASELQAATAI